MKIEKLEGNFIICNEEGLCIASAQTPLEVAAIAAGEYYAEGSTFWNMCIAETILASDPNVLNHWENPFNRE